MQGTDGFEDFSIEFFQQGSLGFKTGLKQF